MATNVNAPRGALARRGSTGAPVVFLTNSYTIATGYATSIFFGDAVKATTTGMINLVASTEQPRGIFQGCEYTDATGTRQKSKYWPASTTATNIIAYVIDDPNVTFEMQTDITPTTTTVGKLFNLTGTASGSTADGLSRAQLTVASQSTAGMLVRVLRFVDRPDNDSTTANAKVECMFAKHDFASAAGV